MGGQYTMLRSPDIGDDSHAWGQIRAYQKIVRYALEGRDGVLAAPVAQLADEQLAALFAPRQLTILVRTPLDRPPHRCDQ
jgi:hypothetical protein